MFNCLIPSATDESVGTSRGIVDLSAPANIAKAILKVNQRAGLRRGLDVLWKLYYTPGQTLTRVALEMEFGLLEKSFGLYCRHVAEELGATELDRLALVNSSRNNVGLEMITLKPSVVTALKCYAFAKFAC